MCIVSQVFDKYDPLFPNPDEWKKWQVTPGMGSTSTLTIITDQNIAERMAQMDALIKEFKDLLEAAKKLDKALNQPDCEDPDKAKLVERVEVLEKIVATHIKPTKKASKAKKIATRKKCRVCRAYMHSTKTICTDCEK